MPDFTTASAMLLIMSSLTLQPNLFQEFHPIGGVSARVGAIFDSWLTPVPTSRTIGKQTSSRRVNVFMGKVVSELTKDWYMQASHSRGACHSDAQAKRARRNLLLLTPTPRPPIYNHPFPRTHNRGA